VDEIGDISCIKASNSVGDHHLWFISSLQDNQIPIFPSEFNWNYHPTELAFRRIRFLFNQGLYFEAIVVSQAIMESIVNGMFPPVLIKKLYGCRELRWEQKYMLLRLYFDGKFHANSELKSMLNSGLKKIYKYRNSISHDYLVHQSESKFNLEIYNEIKALIKPLTDSWTNNHFMSDVSYMYDNRSDFLIWLSKHKN